MRRAIFWLALLVFVGCAKTLDRQEMSTAQLELRQGQGVLRAHLHDGDLVVLEPWQLDLENSRLQGPGRRMDTQRTVVERGVIVLQLEDVALLELDELATAEWATALTAVTFISATVTAACLANPKACFGSCPTFYAGDHLLAEGFSASFAPALEASDLDHLGALEAEAGRVRIEMRNEAFETHYVRSVELLGIPHAEGSMVAADAEGSLWRVRGAGVLLSPHRELLEASDRVEYFSLADSSDLATKEILDLEYAVDADASGPLALMLDSRQSLMSTYLFYQGIAYLGSHYGSWLNSLRGDDPRTGAEGMVELLGGIDIQIRRDDEWTTLQTLAETGPLAIDRKLVPLPASWDPQSEPLRLVMTRGMWRIDAVQLVEIESSTQAISLDLLAVDGAVASADEREASLRDPERHLVTLPGEEFVLEFEALDGPGSYFLRSGGYYVEWMRDGWLKEENPALALAMFHQPAQTLRRLAPQYKLVEGEMESIFWESRYAKP